MTERQIELLLLDLVDEGLAVMYTYNGKRIYYGIK